MIPAYVPLPTPILGCTHAQPYARLQLVADTVEVDGRLMLGPFGGTVAISYRVGYEVDGRFQAEPGAKDREIRVEGENLAVLRALTYLQGAPIGDFRDSDVLAFALDQVPEERLEQARATVAQWRIDFDRPEEQDDGDT